MKFCEYLRGKKKEICVDEFYTEVQKHTRAATTFLLDVMSYSDGSPKSFISR
jgi:hypothetical protein